MLNFATCSFLRRNSHGRTFLTQPMAALQTGFESKPIITDTYDTTWQVTRDRVEKIPLTSTSQFKQYYQYESCPTEPIGFGTFGAVHICTPKYVPNPPRYAVKQMQKLRQPYYAREIEMLKRVSSSQHCIQLKQILETPNTIFLVTDLLEGGDLFDFIVKHNVASKKLTFQECLKLTLQMLLAIEECHIQNFSHLDIKPENFVFRDKTKDSDLVLVDFGAAQPYVFRPFARHNDTYETGLDDFWKGTKRTRITGTVSYIAPEIFLYNRFSSRSDIWSLGVSLFMMLTGQRPFEAKCEQRIEAMVIAESQRNREESIFFTHPTLKSINCPSNIINLLLAFTEAKPENRPSSSEAILLVEELLSKV